MWERLNGGNYGQDDATGDSGSCVRADSFDYLVLGQTFHVVTGSISPNHCDNNARRCTHHVESEILQTGHERIMFLAEHVDDKFFDQSEHQHGLIFLGKMLIAWVCRTRLNTVFSGHKLKLTFIGPYDIGAELNLILVFAARFRRTVNVDYRAHFLMADSSHQFAQSELVFCHVRIPPIPAKFRAVRFTSQS